MIEQVPRDAILDLRWSVLAPEIQRESAERHSFVARGPEFVRVSGPYFLFVRNLSAPTLSR
ncbi:hypothetical protein AB0H43_04690 [Hamadaea sp. NPDC050747]|uniref:hypothetical protein n=1 Tax=Hamadaea sp. NPDC050747 TaxID=3155789 RepID=UPI0033EE51D3